MVVERVDFRSPSQEADTPVIGAFGGLSSATASTTGNITHCQKLTNAYVNKRNEIVRRQGSSIIANVQNLSVADAENVGSHAFTFDNRNYLVVKEGVNLRLLALDSSFSVVDEKLKTGVFDAASAGQKPSFTTVVEDNACFVICVTKSSLPVVLTILQRETFIASQSSPTVFSLSVSNYPANNVTTASKCFLYTAANENLPIVSLSQSAFTFSFVTSSPLTTTNPRIHLVFVCNGVSSAYYPGLYLYNTSVRKNLVPLDVNVRIPDELAANPIINEPALQDLSIDSFLAFKTNGSVAQFYSRVYTQQPTTADSFDFSDGSYRVDPNLRTVRTPLFISFGALQTPTDDTRVFMFRTRSTSTVLPNYKVNRSQLRVYVDKILTPVATYAETGVSVVDDTLNSYYFSLAKNSNPGVSLSAVVEVMYRSNQLQDKPVIDLTEAQVSVTIDDGFLLPFYGLSAIGDVGGNIFPSIVQTVGNRVLMSGTNNRVAVSNSNWNYRGISWNNFQVSTINFSETSAYLLTLTQATSTIKSLLSVNGVIIVGTDSGIYRVSGQAANVPPSATVANISRISNEVVAGQSSMAIYSNRVFYVSKNGLYSLEFNRENEEVNALPLSTQVSNYFTENTATDITYSNFYRAFLISFAETDDILAYFLETETFSVFRLSTRSKVKITPTIDGYQMTADTTTANKHVLFCKWDSSPTDLFNSSSLPALSDVRAIVQTFTENSQQSTLVTPAELVETLNPNLRQSYGYNFVRALGGNVAIAEGTTPNSPLPIISSMVTKAFSQSKLIGANRVRAVSLLLKGSGAARAKVVYQAVDYNDRAVDVTSLAIDSTTGYQGEPLLNYAFVEQNPVGDNINVRVRVFGVSEAWELAIAWDGTLALLGYAFDTSAKKRGRSR